jgi:hypothetical protein
MGSKGNIQMSGYVKIIQHANCRAVMPVLFATRTFMIGMKMIMMKNWGIVNLESATDTKYLDSLLDESRLC